MLVGAGPGSTSTAQVIGLLAGQLGLQPPTGAPGPDSTGPPRLDEAGQSPLAGGVSGDELLAWWAQQLAGLPPRTLIAIDGVDRLDAGDARDTVEVLRSIPRLGGARYLVSTTLPDQAAALQARGLSARVVGPLDPVGVAAAAREWAEVDGHRQLPLAVQQAVADRPRSGLWVRLAVDELAWLEQEDYARAEQATASGMNPDDAIASMLVAEVAGMPDDDPLMAHRLLDRAAAVIGDPAAARTYLGGLAVTRSGLTPADLQTLTGIDPLPLTRARWLLGGQLVARDAAGRLTFDHALLRASATDPDDLRAVQALHARLADHLASPGGGAADPDATPDRTAVADRLWHALLGADPDPRRAALRRSWTSHGP